MAPAGQARDLHIRDDLQDREKGVEVREVAGG
jgi:hypothetical protein